MKTIWKYEMLLRNSIFTIPEGAEFLMVQRQGNFPCIWFLVSPNATKECRKFSAYGTGQEVPYDPGIYRGTIQTGNGLVHHIFEEK